jgi:hypothetical protein
MTRLQGYFFKGANWEKEQCRLVSRLAGGLRLENELNES